MTTHTLDNARVSTQANAYFEGKRVSPGLSLSGGSRHRFSVPANSSFDIGVAEASHSICHFG